MIYYKSFTKIDFRVEPVQNLYKFPKICYNKKMKVRGKNETRIPK